MSGAFVASPIKRQRATKAEMLDRRAALLSIVSAMQPMTVRQVFYQASVRGVVEKSEAGYGKVQRDLADMRRDGSMPYHWLADTIRYRIKPETYGGVAEALQATARFYRKALWADADAHVEIWLEKDALRGVLHPVTDFYDVSLMVTRGYASLSFLYGAAEYISELDRPAFIYHFGDYDPSGVDAARKIRDTLREMAPDAPIHFYRVAVTPEQVQEWNLPTRPTKRSDSRSKRFGAVSVELDAVEPETLRGLVRQCIEDHLPADELNILKVAEESERRLLTGMVEGLA